jgi:hypothetical protein
MEEYLRDPNQPTKSLKSNAYDGSVYEVNVYKEFECKISCLHSCVVTNAPLPYLLTRCFGAKCLQVHVHINYTYESLCSAQTIDTHKILIHV